jgi:hypothetical protein
VQLAQCRARSAHAKLSLRVAILSRASKTVAAGVRRVERPLHSVEVEGLPQGVRAKSSLFLRDLELWKSSGGSIPSNSSRDYTEGLCIEVFEQALKARVQENRSSWEEVLCLVRRNP